VLVDGQWTVVGGTSAVAPLIAGLIALANQKLKGKLDSFIRNYIHLKLRFQRYFDGK
jgi:kumamolisin